MDDKLLTVAEAAEFLGVTKQTIYTLKDKNEIPYRKIGGSIRFVKSELLNLGKK